VIEEPWDATDALVAADPGGGQGAGLGLASVVFNDHLDLSPTENTALLVDERRGNLRGLAGHPALVARAPVTDPCRPMSTGPLSVAPATIATPASRTHSARTGFFMGSSVSFWK
jgi:hypothetical protein